VERTDYELIQNILEGCQDDFAELVGRYKKLIFSVVQHYFKDREEISDISQEVFIKIYKSLRSYNPEFKFSTWSVRVASNLCLDILRKKKVATIPIEEIEWFAGENDTPEKKLLEKQRSLEIRNAINNLPEKYRTPVILYHQNGASYKDMAEMLKQPMSLVKNRLYRARLLLRQNMINLESKA